MLWKEQRLLFKTWATLSIFLAPAGPCYHLSVIKELSRTVLYQRWRISSSLLRANARKNSIFIVEVHLANKLVHRHSTFWIKLNRLRIPTGRRQTSWLYTSATEEMSQRPPGTNPRGGQNGTWTRDLQISSPAPWPLGTLPLDAHDVIKN